MSDQVPECKKAFSCKECERVESCDLYAKFREKREAIALKLVEDMPILIKFFGFCALKGGNIEDWQKILEKLSFGC